MLIGKNRIRKEEKLPIYKTTNERLFLLEDADTKEQIIVVEEELRKITELLFGCLEQNKCGNFPISYEESPGEKRFLTLHINLVGPSDSGFVDVSVVEQIEQGNIKETKMVSLKAEDIWK